MCPLTRLGSGRLARGRRFLELGGGFDGGTGYFIANSPIGDDLHVIGPTEPLFPGKIAAVTIRPDGTRKLVKLIPDPLADWRKAE